MYVHTGKSLFLTDGPDRKVVEEGQEGAAVLLVADGGTLPDDIAQQYGLTNAQPAEEQPAEEGEKAAAPAPENKQRAGAAENKAK